MFLRKLVLSNLLTRRTRTALTVAAVALSVSLVVSVTSGYASIMAAVHQYVEKYVGTVDAQVTRVNDPRGAISGKILNALRADPDVKQADGRVEISAPLLDENGKPLESRTVTVIGIDRPTDNRIENLNVLKGEFFDTNDGNICVIDQALAKQLQLDLNSIVGLGGKRKLALRVVGIVHKPEVLAAHLQTVYVPLKTLQWFQDWDQSAAGGEQVNRLSIEFSRGVDPRTFEKKWKEKLAALEPTARLRLTRDIREQIDRLMIAVELMSYLGGAVSMLAATFIVFSSLSMGVTERQRTLAMLRAVGATKWQVAVMVVIEGLILSGLGAGIGAPLGWLWIKILSWIFTDFFSAGVAVSWPGVTIGVGGSILAALGASVLPAWHATRVSPLEAMNPLAAPSRPRTPLYAAVGGLLLIGIDPLLFFGPIPTIVRWFGPEEPDALATAIKVVLHFIVGLPTLMVGFFLLAPLFVAAADRLFSRLAAWLLRIEPSLLRQQLSSGVWRAAGTAASLMVGLAVLIVLQVQGKSAMSSWELPNKFPDLFIVSPPGASLGNIFGNQPARGVEVDQVQRLEKVEGIRDGEIMPIAIASPQFGHGMTSVLLTAINPEATMFFGIDPNKAFDMMELRFIEGSTAAAKQYLLGGTAVRLKKDQTAIPETALMTVDRDGKPMPQKGVARSRGQFLIQGMVSTQGDHYSVTVPGRDQPFVVPVAAAEGVEHGRFLIVTNEFRELKGLGLGDMFPLRRAADGEQAEYTIVGVVWSPGIDVIVSVFDMGRQFDQRTASSVFGSVRDAKEDFGVERIYLFAANLDWGFPREQLVKHINKELKTEGMVAGDVRQIKEAIAKGFDRLLLLASTVAFAALAVASLGVTNTIMAGIRTRRWHFGVLRSIGVTRGQLLRMVLAEAFLLGIVACMLGLCAGMLMVVDAHALQVAVVGFNPRIDVPWDVVGYGVGIVLAIALLASAWPASTVAFSEPLKLLQAGRASS